MSVTRKLDICDDCSLVAYDMGVEGWHKQVNVMVTLGLDLPDHICIKTEEPELTHVVCDCACNKNRFKEQRERMKRS